MPRLAAFAKSGIVGSRHNKTSHTLTLFMRAFGSKIYQFVDIRRNFRNFVPSKKPAGRRAGELHLAEIPHVRDLCGGAAFGGEEPSTLADSGAGFVLEMHSITKAFPKVFSRSMA